MTTTCQGGIITRPSNWVVPHLIDKQKKVFKKYIKSWIKILTYSSRRPKKMSLAPACKSKLWKMDKLTILCSCGYSHDVCNSEISGVRRKKHQSSAVNGSSACRRGLNPVRGEWVWERQSPSLVNWLLALLKWLHCRHHLWPPCFRSFAWKQSGNERGAFRARESSVLQGIMRAAVSL